jgi:glycosyltransferase involved in cell wall biosynthesis
MIGRATAAVLCHIWTLFVQLTVVIARFRRRRNHVHDSRRTGLTMGFLGPFKAANWTRSYLNPLLANHPAAHVVVVLDKPMALPDGITILQTNWLARKLFGDAIARALRLLVWSMHHEPDLIVGVHLPWNGLAALCIAKLTGTRAYYFCVGGAEEILDGGLRSEHQLFQSLGAPSAALERRLIALANAFDGMFTMGERTISRLRDMGVTIPALPMAVSIDSTRFFPLQGTEKEFDLICVARLAAIKRIDRILDAAPKVTAKLGRPLRLVVVGDGPLRAELERQCHRNGISDSVTFVGWDDEVERWLRKSRAFILSSESEGLPISMLEAMSCGLPAIVPSTGDVEDALSEREGVVLHDPSPDSCAVAMLQLLTLNDAAYGAKCASACRSASRYHLPERRARWARFLSSASIGEPV